MNTTATNAIKHAIWILTRDIEDLQQRGGYTDRLDEYRNAAAELQELIEGDQGNPQAETLELYITTSDRRTLDAADFAFRHVSRAVDAAARELAKQRAAWHDDPEAEDHAEFHAPAFEQFTDEARAAVVVALLERCERIRQENLLNERANA